MAAVAPIITFGRYAITAGAAVWSNWDALSRQLDRAEVNDEPIFGIYCQTVFQMKTAGGAFDDTNRGMFGVHWLNTTGGALDATWDRDDYLAVHSAVAQFATAMASYVPNSIRFTENRFYPFGPGVTKPNPPDEVFGLGGIAGAASAASPYQLATSVTIRTALRVHWGRFYLPASANNISGNGLFGPSFVTNVASAARTFLSAPGASRGIVPCVYDRVRHTAFGMTELAVDDVPDIIRRRRPPHGILKTVFDAPE